MENWTTAELLEQRPQGYRVLASHLFLAYCRCRHSDTLQIEDVEHDHSEKAGYRQLKTRYHKGSKTAAKKSLLLPIMASSAGVGSPEWIQLWWENRMQANLAVSGSLRGPLLPAPRDGDSGWTGRPVTSIYRDFEYPQDFYHARMIVSVLRTHSRLRRYHGVRREVSAKNIVDW